MCGSDGKTYRNYSSLRKKMCTTKAFINVDHLGPCAGNRHNSVLVRLCCRYKERCAGFRERLSRRVKKILHLPVNRVSARKLMTRGRGRGGEGVLFTG